jgi:hypothetical protein
MAVTREAVESASRRGARLGAEYGATGVRYDATEHMVCIQLNAACELQVSPLAVRALHGAPERALSNVRLSASKLGLYFPDLDVDLSIPNLVHSEDGRQIRLVRQPV